MMKSGSTLILKTVVIMLGLLALALAVVGLPLAISTELRDGADFDYGFIFLGLYLPAIPFFVTLRQALKLLGLIDRNEAFSIDAVHALMKIKYCALAITGLFALGMPYVFYVADRDDAPGTALVGFVVIGASFVIAMAAAVFQRLLQNAVDIKSENDLTV